MQLQFVFKDALKRLEKLLKADMNHDHKKIIIELTVKRNSIVHENKEYEVTDNYFEEIQESLHHLLDFIRDNLKRLGVTVFDPINDYGL
ncbi:hypothetical protein P5G60_13670 [Paenibacillus jamilae]|nr:hypothetical protein [Paenibacillus jamilae]